MQLFEPGNKKSVGDPAKEKPTSASSREIPRFPQQLDDKPPSSSSLAQPSLDLSLSSSKGLDNRTISFLEKRRPFEFNSGSDADRLRNFMSFQPERQNTNSSATGALFRSSGSAVYSSLTDLNSLSSNLVSLKSSDTNMLMSAGSGIHSNASLPFQQNFLNSTVKQEIPSALQGLWRHHSAPGAIQREISWPLSPFPIQPDTASSPTSFRDFLSPNNNSHLPSVPEATAPAAGSLKGLGDHLSLASGSSIGVLTDRANLSNPLRRSDSTSLSLWSGKESGSFDLNLGRRDTEEVASLLSLDLMNNREQCTSKMEDGRKRRALLDEPAREDKGSKKKSKLPSHIKVIGMSGTLDRSQSGELAAALAQENVVLCKARAKRGFATHPRSIAERVRRTRIADNMKKLQELIPGVDKQSNTADMLEDAVDYMKFLTTKVLELSGGDREQLNFSSTRQKGAESPTGGGSSKSGSESDL